MIRKFKIFLWIIALHSFIAGLLLILLGDSGIQFFGFEAGNPFFQVQAGVFHMVLSAAYILTAFKLARSQLLIIFIILAKTLAFIYLLIYFFCIDPIMIVLLSGVLDGSMAIMVYFFYLALPDNYFRGGRS